jgi:hypothetical protein
MRGGGHFGGGFGFAQPGFRPAPTFYYQQLSPICAPLNGVDGYMSGGWCIYPMNTIPKLPEAPMPTVPTPQIKPASSPPTQHVPDYTHVDDHPIPPKEIPTPTGSVASPVQAAPTTTVLHQPTATPHVQPSPGHFSPGMLALLGGIAVIVICRGRLIEWLAVSQAGIRDTTTRIVAETKARREEARHQAVWERLARTPPHKYEAEKARRQDCIDRLAKRAATMQDVADRWEASPIRWGWAIRILRDRAEKHVAAGHAIYDEIEATEKLWLEIEEAREVKRRNDARASINHLLNLLNSANDAAASAALKKLNKVRSTVDWDDLPPPDLPPAARAQASKMLQLLAGTTSLPEAKAALQKLKNLFADNDMSFERMAA